MSLRRIPCTENGVKMVIFVPIFSIIFAERRKFLFSFVFVYGKVNYKWRRGEQESNVGFPSNSLT
jgi:hypothetical protein